jgi:hypothetical protein
MQPVLDAWAAEKADFPNYDSGSDGPKATDELLTDDGGRGFETGAADPRFGVGKTPHSKVCSIADRCLVGAVCDRGPEHRPRRGESC